MKPKKLNRQEEARARSKAAMPEVKRLVVKFGRTAINNCLIKLREYEKSTKKLADLKKEVEILEKRIT